MLETGLAMFLTRASLSVSDIPYGNTGLQTRYNSHTWMERLQRPQELGGFSPGCLEIWPGFR